MILHLSFILNSLYIGYVHSGYNNVEENDGDSSKMTTIDLNEITTDV